MRALQIWFEPPSLGLNPGSARKRLDPVDFTDECLAPPAFDAAAGGFEVTAVVDASGSQTSLLLGPARRGRK